MSGYLHLIVPRTRFRLLQRRARASRSYALQHRHRAAPVLPALRGEVVLRAALESRRLQRQRALPRSRDGRAASRSSRSTTTIARRPRRACATCRALDARDRRDFQPAARGRLREEQPGLDHGIRVERHALDALLEQPARQIRMIGGPLAADADVLAVACGRRRSPSTGACAPPGRARRSSCATIAESRSSPSVSCVMSFEPIDMPSKYSRYSSASSALVGSSHIMMTLQTVAPRSSPFAASSSRDLARLGDACARTAP